MVSKIKADAKGLKWFHTYQPVDGKKVLDLLKKIPFNLPKKYLDFLKLHDGGDLDYEFQYYSTSLEENIVSGVSFIYGVCSGSNNLIDEYYDPPEFFPNNLVAFGETGGGNLICFDYRKDPTSENPPIVYWNHEAMDEKNVSFLANDFEEFLSILKEPNEE